MPANASPKKLRFDPWVRKIPWGRAWKPTPCLGNLMDRGAWQDIVHGVTKSDMTEGTWHSTHSISGRPSYWPTLAVTMPSSSMGMNQRILWSCYWKKASQPGASAGDQMSFLLKRLPHGPAFFRILCLKWSLQWVLLMGEALVITRLAASAVRKSGNVSF